MARKDRSGRPVKIIPLKPANGGLDGVLRVGGYTMGLFLTPAKARLGDGTTHFLRVTGYRRPKRQPIYRIMRKAKRAKTVKGALKAFGEMPMANERF